MTATAQQPSRAAGFSQRRQLRSGLASAGALSTLLGGLLLAVPGLGAIGHRVTHAHWGWLMLGAGLELASCAGYVLAFQGIFKEIPARFAALVATAEQAFGAVVPVGGAGGIAAGSWLLSRAGLPLGAIAERSAVLFLLTSATNVVALVLAGAGLAIGVIAGPRDLVLSAVPAGAGLAVLILFVGLARRAPGRTGTGSTLRVACAPSHRRGERHNSPSDPAAWMAPRRRRPHLPLLRHRRLVAGYLRTRLRGTRRPPGPRVSHWVPRQRHSHPRRHWRPGRRPRGRAASLSRSCVRRTGRSAPVPRARSVDPSAFRNRRVHCRSAPDQLKRHQIHARARYRRLRPRYLDE